MLAMARCLSAFGVLPPIFVVAALLLATSESTYRARAQETNRGSLPVTSFGTSDVPGPDILPQIYAIHLDGSGRKPLLPKRTEAFDPDLSPDGKRIVFVASNGEKLPSEKHAWVLYVMNVDGSGRRRLTETANTAERLLAPNWSADGKKIAFSTLGWGMGKTGPVMSSPPRVCIIDADGRNLKRLEKLIGVNAVWSPDGKRLLFTCLGKDFHAGLCVADADGTGVRSLLKRNDYQMVTGAWSPDGKRLAYAVPSDDDDSGDDRKPNQAGLFLAQADGSQPRRLVGGPKEITYGVKWSKDSKRLYFTHRDRSGPLFDERDPAQGRRWSPCAVYAIDVDAKNLRRLTTGKERDFVGGNALFGARFLTD
jgi:Tol biopolymer transport system component